jgi:aldehyde:ferredoxin oxidoreductase
MTEYGYAGEILNIDLSTHSVTHLETSQYSDRFLGGRGIGAKLFWDFVPSGINAFDPENCLVFITGPIAGFTGFAGCRWQICGKSPQVGPGFFSYANAGGSWGAWLKFIGYDGLIVNGKAQQPIFLYIDDQGKVEFRDASHLWGLTNGDTHKALAAEFGKDCRIFSIGPAGENGVYFSTGMTSDFSTAGGGLISVMGNKKLKAVVIKANQKKRPVAAQPEKVELLAKQVYEIKEKNWDPFPKFETLGNSTPCYGCLPGPGRCSRRTYQTENGDTFRAFCQATTLYFHQATKYFKGDSSTTYHLATQLCDNFGLDSMVMESLIEWLGLCYQAGILSERETELPLSRIGSSEFIIQLVRKISYKEGFGEILAGGTLRASEQVGKDSQKLLGAAGVSTRDSLKNDYDPRLIYANGLINATEPRKAIQLLHSIALPLRRWVEWLNKKENVCLDSDVFRRIAEQYWGSIKAADLTSYEGKALAAKLIQDLGYARESLIVCDLMWQMMYQVRTNYPDITCGTLESRIVSAITGKEINEKELMKIGERVFNLQRMILLRDGWSGRNGDVLLDYHFEEPLQRTILSEECLVPGDKGQVVSRKGNVIDKNEFEKMKSEYYALRGWEVETGYPTPAKLQELELGDIRIS